MLRLYLSGLGQTLVKPATCEVGRHWIEVLKNPTVVRDQKVLEVFGIRPIGFKEAIQKAIASTNM